MAHVRACPQIKEVSKQKYVISKTHAKALLLKLRKRANMTTKGPARASPQIKGASKLTDVTSKRHAKALVLKLWMRANMSMKGLVRASPQITKEANKQM